MSRKTVVNWRMLSRRSSSGAVAAARARGPKTPPNNEQTKIVKTKTSEERRLAAPSNLHPLKREQSAYYTREKEGLVFFITSCAFPQDSKRRGFLCLWSRLVKSESRKLQSPLGPKCPAH